MAGLALQRCALHPAREAVCRCPLCSRLYCRECVTEHEERLICSACLARLAAAVPKSSRSGWLAASLFCLAGFSLAVLFFYGAGQLLALTLAAR